MADALLPDNLAATIEPILAEAGEIALRWFRTKLDADDKGGRFGYDPVTEADRGVEDLIRERLTAAFPDHQITGEERGTTGPAGRFRWLIDPIDGTKAFVSGSPLWGILLGLVDEGRPVSGWLHQPYIGETFAGVDGVPSFVRGPERKALATNPDVRLDSAIVYTTFPPLDQPYIDNFERIRQQARLVRYGGDCYAYALVAMGHADAVIEYALQPYDIVPIIPIIEAAGGVVTGLDGQPPADGGYVLASANPELHAEIVSLLTP